MSIYVNLEVETENSYPSSARELQSLLEQRACFRRIEGFQAIKFFSQPSNVGVCMFIEGLGSINGEIYIDGDSCRNFKMKFVCDSRDAVREHYRAILVFIYNIFFDTLCVFDKDSLLKFNIEFIENDILRGSVLSPIHLFGVRMVHNNGTGIAKTNGLKRFNLKEIAIFFENIDLETDFKRIHEILNFAAISSLERSEVQNGIPLFVGDNYTNKFKLSIALIAAKNSIDYKFLSLSLKDELADYLMIAVPVDKGRRSSNRVKSFTDVQQASLMSTFSVAIHKYQLGYMKSIAESTMLIAEDKAKKGEDVTIFAASGVLTDMTESKVKESVYNPSDYDSAKECFVCYNGRKKILINKDNVFWWQYSLGGDKVVTPRNVINKVAAAV